MNLTKKVCPPDKILNPVSSRCVSKTSKLGKSILQEAMQQPAMQPQSMQQPTMQQPTMQQPAMQQKQPEVKICPPDKVLNPASSRCVSKTSALGKSILKNNPMKQQEQKKQSPKKQPQKQPTIKICPPDKVLNPLTSKCVNRTSKLGKTILKEQNSRHMNSPIQQRASPIQQHVSPMQQRASPIQQHVSLNSHTLKRNKASIIARFMKRTKYARKATALNAICSDSGLCIAFGRQSDEIKKFFNGFSSFDYVESFKMAGTPSMNGFIYAINYKHRGYIANAILKSSASVRADNLMYEYAVGTKINSLFYKKFPVFVETYDYYYRYPNEQMWQAFKSETYANKLKNALIPYDNLDYQMSCTESKHICILIQHINNAPTLAAMCQDTKFIQTELINSLYQIYFTLSIIKNSFTHYDLHTSNVLVYTPTPNKYIEYHFHTLLGEIITFKSKHLIKIIDYGRSYVKGISEDVLKKVCNENACNPYCGDDFGYWMMPNLPHFINSSRHNNSHDLRLLHIINSDLKLIYKPANSVETILHSELNKLVYSGKFGTAEIIKTNYPAKITNVSDVELALKRIIKSGLFKTTNDNYMAGHVKMGDLTVYSDGRDMEYVPSN